MWMFPKMPDNCQWSFLFLSTSSLSYCDVLNWNKMPRCDLFSHWIMTHWYIFSTFLLRKSGRVSQWRIFVVDICFCLSELKIPQSFLNIHAFPSSSILISSHYHYLLFATSILSNSLSIKVTDIPMSPLSLRDLFQVYVIQLYFKFVILVYNIVFFPTIWSASFNYFPLNIFSQTILKSCFYIRIYLKISKCYCLFFHLLWLLMQVWGI